MLYVLESDSARGHFLKEFMVLKPTKENPVRVTIERGQPPKKRTNDQNSIFHAWCNVLANETGHTQEEIKTYLKDMFLPAKIVSVGAKSRMIRPGTSTLDTSQMGTLLDRIEVWAATDLGITLPRNL